MAPICPSVLPQQRSPILQLPAVASKCRSSQDRSREKQMDSLDQVSSASSSPRRLHRVILLSLVDDYRATKLCLHSFTIRCQAALGIDAGFDCGDPAISCPVRDHSEWPASFWIALCSGTNLKHWLYLVSRNDRYHEEQGDGFL